MPPWAGRKGIPTGLRRTAQPLGGFSFHRPSRQPRILRERMTGERYRLFFGQNRETRGQDVLRGIDVRVIGVATGHTSEMFARPVVRMDVAADRTGLTGVGGGNLDDASAAPGELVFQLPGPHRPALV